jgi:hypothetical protein
MKPNRSSSAKKLGMLVVTALVVFSLAVGLPGGVAFADTPTPAPHTGTRDTGGLT